MSVYTHNTYTEHKGESKYCKEVSMLKETTMHFKKVFLSLILMEQIAHEN